MLASLCGYGLYILLKIEKAVLPLWSLFLCESGHGEVWDRRAACESSSAWVYFKILLSKWVFQCEREKGLSP